MTIKAVKRRSKKARGPVVPQPAGWMDIQVGSVVLASIAPRPTEWFEVVVTEIEGEEFVLRFADWPDEPVFRRARDELALLHPTRKPLPPLEPTKAEPLPVDEAA